MEKIRTYYLSIQNAEHERKMDLKYKKVGPVWGGESPMTMRMV